MNHTFITLIPKVQNLNEISQFRPISRVNTTHKLISKILSNRLAILLQIILKKKISPLKKKKKISPNQTAFGKGKNISDNSNLAEELLKGFEQRATPKRARITVDLRKAFDSISWKAIENTLVGMGFEIDFIGMIMKCITTNSFSVLVERQPSK